MRLALALTATAIGATVSATVPADGARTPDARYSLSIAGIPIGSATLSVAVDDGTYLIDGSADFGFLFWGGSGGARVEGVARDGVWRPTRYRLAYEGVRRPGGMEIDFEDGRAVRVHSFPPPPPDVMQGRVALTDTHLRDVLDPLTALVIPAPADADPETVCRRLLPVFSGFTRFDLELAGPRVASSGAACRTRYVPVAGHRPDSRSVERMQKPGAFEVSLTAITPEAWGPARVAVETRFGTFEMVREP